MEKENLKVYVANIEKQKQLYFKKTDICFYMIQNKSTFLLNSMNQYISNAYRVF